MKYKLVFISILFCLTFIPYRLLSIDQYINKQTLDKNNFKDLVVFNIIQDKYGFVWISSRSGLSKYDGRNLKYYSLSDGDIMSDNDGRQTLIRKDEKNQIWAFTDSRKIYVYDPMSDSFRHFFTATPSEGYFLLNDIFWDSTGILWLATTRGLACYDPSEEGQHKLVTFEEREFITLIYPISESVLVVGTINGLLFFDTSKKEILPERFYENENITSIYKKEGSDQLWIGTFSSGLYTWDSQSLEDITPSYIRSLPNTPIKVIRSLNDSTLLVGMDGRGVYKIDTTEEKAELFLSATEKDGATLDGNGVYDILVENENIWVGTYTGGVTIIRKPGFFKWTKHIAHNKQSLMNDHIHAVHEDSDGDIWYATKSGVSRYDFKTNSWKFYFEGENTFLTITEDSDGNIWCGGFSTGIYCINKQNGNIRHIKSLKNTAQADCIYASAKDSDGNLWFGGLYNPLTCLSKNKDGKEEYSFYEIYEVHSINPINNDSLFIATSNGFYILNRKAREFKQHFSDPAQYGIKSTGFIYNGVLVGDDIWFGTDGSGLNCFNIKTEKVENFTTHNNLPSNHIYSITKDNNNILWISSNKGIFSFDPIRKLFLHNVEGLPVKQFVFNSYTNTCSGELIFGSRDGAIMFDPDNVTKETTAPHLYFTDFRLFYKKITARDRPDILSSYIDDVSGIELEYDQNTFSIDYISLDLYDTDNYTYEYILEGFDKDWIIKGNGLTADYMNIPPGEYIFKVRSIDSNGKEILAERSIPIKIHQPLWNTVWAWLFYMALIISVLYWAWSYSRDKLLKKQSEEKINFFVNIAHDIRTPLSLVVAPLKDLEKDKTLSPNARNYLKLAKQNCDKLLSTVTQLLDFQKVDSTPVSLELSFCDFKAYLKQHIEQFDILAHKKSIFLELEMPEEDIMTGIDKKKMDHILDNLLSNAIKYTNANGRVNVRLRKKEKTLVLEIEDNGIGISRSEQKKIFRHFYRADNAVNSKESGSGIGLVFTKKLVELIHGKLSFTSQEGKGTIFTFSWPLMEGAGHLESALPEKVLAQYADADFDPQIQAPDSKLRHDNYKILLVEDNDDMRSYLTHTLSLQYNIIAKASAEEALEFLKDQTVNLVIADIMMPGMNGDELCRRLKNNIETSHIQVILLTALAEKSQVLTGLEHGADDYITKPFDVEILKIKIRNFITTRKRLQQYYLTINNLQDIIDNGIKEQEEIKGNSIDDDFLNRCIQIVTRNISNADFTINDLCRELAMSRTLVYEKLKILTTQSPNEFIRSIRLKQAKDLLLSHKYTIQEIAEKVGFADSRYFSKVFKKYYGESPQKYADAKNNS